MNACNCPNPVRCTCDRIPKRAPPLSEKTLGEVAFDAHRRFAKRSKRTCFWKGLTEEGRCAYEVTAQAVTAEAIRRLTETGNG